MVDDWCAQKIGNGSQVLVGVDPLCGTNSTWKLSDQLVQVLRIKGIITSNDAFISSSENMSGGWKQADDIGLINEIACEQSYFLKALYQMQA